MKTLTWRHTDFIGRDFVFQVGKEVIGNLCFTSNWNFNAVYSDSATKLRFNESDDIWRRTVSITRDGKLIGYLRGGMFGQPTITLLTEEKYVLASNFFGRDVRWENERGEAVVKYQQATMSSMGRGTITMNSTLTEETEKLLMSAGLFIKQLVIKRFVLIFLIMLPILVASRG